MDSGDAVLPEREEAPGLLLRNDEPAKGTSETNSRWEATAAAASQSASRRSIFHPIKRLFPLSVNQS